jgi:hypothetical protein
MMTASDSDQNEFDKQPSGWHDHLEKAFLHHTGHGRHPGQYKGPSLAQLRQEMEYPQQMSEQQGELQPTPPEEALPPQPPLQGGKSRPSKPPSKGTPTAIGEAAVEKPPPAGEF